MAPASAPALQSRRGRNTTVKGAQEGCQCSRIVIVMLVPCIQGGGRRPCAKLAGTMALLNGLTAGGAHTLRFMLLPRTGIHRMSEAQAKRWLPKKLQGAAAASCLRRHDNNKLATAAFREVKKKIFSRNARRTLATLQKRRSQKPPKGRR
eukprot:scaffold11968_cov102-Isochrysis_galbana.AAC.1